MILPDSQIGATAATLLKVTEAAQHLDVPPSIQTHWERPRVMAGAFLTAEA